MNLSINRDAVAGVVLGALGAFVAIYAYLSYPLGNMARMGPGMFPLLLGVTLLLIAIAIFLLSFLRQRHSIEVNLRAGGLILLALAIFAATVDPVGVVPSMMVLMVISYFAVPGRNILTTIILSAAVTALMVIIFVYIMNLHLKLFAWPL